MKVALYARVSTDEQAKDGYSIGAQCKKLQQYADLHDWEAVLYIDDGYSAKDLNRPQISKLFKDIESGEINTVVVYKLDRLIRSVRNLYELLDLFDSCNCNFISLTESLDTSSASGRFFITILGAMAQWERETIGERTFFGMKEAIKSGKVNSRPPLGYKKVDGKFVINEKEAFMVQRIFEEYCQGLGVLRVIRKLQKEGVLPSDGAEGASWCTTKMLRVLKNRAYVGDFVVNFRDGEQHINKGVFPPIISNELFNEANLIMDRRRMLHPRARGDVRLFTGVLTCNECGGLISGCTPKGMRYVCGNKYKPRGCTCGTFGEAELEKVFIEYVTSLLNSINDESVGSTKSKSINTKLKLSKELDKIKNIKLKNHTAFENDLVSFEDYKKRINELNERELEITNLLDQEDTGIPKILDFKDGEFGKTWSCLERKDKRNLVIKYIKKITMYKHPKGKTLGKLVIYNIEFL